MLFYELYAEMLSFEIPTTEVNVCSIDSSYVWCQHERFLSTLFLKLCLEFVSEIIPCIWKGIQEPIVCSSSALGFSVLLKW